MKHIKKIIAIVAILSFSLIAFVACGNDNDVSWISPMLSFEVDNNETTVWSGADLVRTAVGGNPMVFDGANSDITAEALVAGGAVRSTVNIAYDGDGEFYVRLVAFAYEFSGHGRLTTRLAQTSPSVMVLWRNPANGHWFNIIRETVGSHEARASNHHIYSLSHGGANPVIRLNRETVGDFSELELFIVPTIVPERIYRTPAGATDPVQDTVSGFVINFTIELPDTNNHFHIFETVATSSTRIFVEE